MEPRIQYATASDGARVAYARLGEGPALVVCPFVLSTLLFKVPSWLAFIDHLARGRTIVLYDERGCGLSGGTPTDLSLDARVRDLEAVIDATSKESIALLASSLSGPVGITYAVATRWP